MLTNIGMAGMNGWEVAQRVREEDHARLEALGIRRCLFKPVGPAELRRRPPGSAAARLRARETIDRFPADCFDELSLSAAGR